jgi:hypothetical protein
LNHLAGESANSPVKEIRADEGREPMRRNLDGSSHRSMVDALATERIPLPGRSCTMVCLEEPLRGELAVARQVAQFAVEPVAVEGKEKGGQRAVGICFVASGRSS